MGVKLLVLTSNTCDDVWPILSFETENMSLSSVSKDFTSCASISERCASVSFEHI